MRVRSASAECECGVRVRSAEVRGAEVRGAEVRHMQVRHMQVRGGSYIRIRCDAIRYLLFGSCAFLTAPMRKPAPYRAATWPQPIVVAAAEMVALPPTLAGWARLHPGRAR